MFGWVTLARLGVVGVFRVRVGSIRRALRSSCSSSSRWFAGASLGIVVFIRSYTLKLSGFIEDPVVSLRRAFWGVLFICVRVGSLRRSLRSPGSLGFECVYSGVPRGRRVHWVSRVGLLVRAYGLPGSLGVTLALQKVAGFNRGRVCHSGALGVVVFFLIRVGSLWRSLGSSRSF